MKVAPIFLLSLLISTSFLKAQKLDIKIDFNDLNIDKKTVGDLIEITDPEKFSCDFTITGVSQKSDIDKLMFIISNNGKDHPIPKDDLDVKYSSKIYKFTIGHMMNNLKPGIFTIRKKEKDKKYLYEVSFKDISSNDPKPFSITQFQLDAQEEFSKRILPYFKTTYSLEEKKGLYIQDSKEVKTVFIFVDAFGKYYGKGVPTIATQQYQYEFVLILNDEIARIYDFEFDYTGNYNSTFNIETTGVKAQSSSKKISYLRLGAIGPFTDKFNVSLTRKKDGKESTFINRDITVAKLYHVSISTGLFATSLKNPQNIEIVPRIMDGQLTGDSTLIADDPNARGVFTIMATYYPKGRSFLFPPSGGPFDPSRIGILVGAQLDDSYNENFFLGLSFDFARGGSFAAGAHFGRRNYVAGDKYDSFDFGTDKFTGELHVKKEWDLGLFFGVVIDTRVAGQLFKKLGSVN